MSQRIDRRSALAGAAMLAAGATMAKEADATAVQVRAAGFVDTLVVNGPHPSLGKHADTYGRLIGSWAGSFVDHLADETVETGPMEVHFAWVLDGRAVQDVWIAPALTARRAGPIGGRRDTFGSTVRVFDPAIDAWRVVWLNPPKNIRTDLIGRRVGDDIVQAGWFGDAPIRWIFSRITRESFLWRATVLEADGTTWRLVTEFNLTRTR